MVTVVSWNIAMRLQAVEELLAMDADVALLQEVGPGALDRLRNAGGNAAVGPQDPWEPWPREHFDRWPMVVKLSDRVEVEWFSQVLPSTPSEGDDEIAVSNVGIIAAAKIIPLSSGTLTSVVTGSWRLAISTTSTALSGAIPWSGTSGTEACLSAWVRWAWSSWGHSIPTGGWPAPRRSGCVQTRKMSQPTTPPDNHRQPPQISWTTCSPRGGSTAGCMRGP